MEQHGSLFDPMLHQTTQVSQLLCLVHHHLSFVCWLTERCLLHFVMQRLFNHHCRLQSLSETQIMFLRLIILMASAQVSLFRRSSSFRHPTIQIPLSLLNGSSNKVMSRQERSDPRDLQGRPDPQGPTGPMGSTGGTGGVGRYRTHGQHRSYGSCWRGGIGGNLYRSSDTCKFDHRWCGTTQFSCIHKRHHSEWGWRPDSDRRQRSAGNCST